MRKWTLEEKLKQSQLISDKKPWLYSTGPKTLSGKAISKMNAYKHGCRSVEVRDLEQSIAKYKRDLSTILKSYLG